VGVAHKKTEYGSYTNNIDNSAQYNDKWEWLYISLQMWIYAPLQTDKWVWLHIRSQKVSGRGSQRSYSELLNVYIVKLIN